MAIAGGTTTAYYLWVGGDARCIPASATSATANWWQELSGGERLLIAGEDIVAVSGKAWGLVRTYCMDDAETIPQQGAHMEKATVCEHKVRSLAHRSKHRLATLPPHPLRTCEQCATDPITADTGWVNTQEYIRSVMHVRSRVRCPGGATVARTHHSTPRSGERY